MTGFDLQHDSAFDTDEDNNPFPTGGLASLIQGQREDERGQPKTEGSPKIAVPYKNGPNTKHNSNSRADDESTDEGADSLLLYQGEDDSNTVHVDHETRVSRLLAPEKKVHVVINEAGKSNEGMSNSSKKYIVYTIKLTDSLSDELQTRRRYSDFESLRDILTRIFPLVIIPPIPPKNYDSWSIFNGFVGSTSGSSIAASNGASNSTNGLAAVSGSDSPPNSGPSYSYINSNHLNKGRLIEHRKRLLANFLNNCLLIPQIRKLAFFAKFLDPSANWSDEVNFMNSQLPKSVYQLNPENGLNTDEVYAYLPLPLSNHSISLPFLTSIKNKLTLKLNYLSSSSTAHSDLQPPTQASSQLGEASEPIHTSHSVSKTNESTNSPQLENSVVNKSHLDEINKRIMSNYIGLAGDYIDLGAFLNSFSMVLADTAKVGSTGELPEHDVKVDLVFDKIGVVHDNSLTTINALIADLETKFSEPLGEAVKYTSVFESTKRFKAKKLKQSRMVDYEISDKKKELAECLRVEMEISKIERGNQILSMNKSAAYSLGPTQQPIAAERNLSKSRFLPNIGPVKKLTRYVSGIMDQNPELTRKQRITQLQERISVLEKCQKIMLLDISFITDELNKNAEKFHKNELRSMFEILLNYNRIFIAWAKRNVELWEEAKEEIRNIDT